MRSCSVWSPLRPPCRWPPWPRSSGSTPPTRPGCCRGGTARSSPSARVATSTGRWASRWTTSPRTPSTRSSRSSLGAACRRRSRSPRGAPPPLLERLVRRGYVVSWFRNVYAMGLDEAVPAPHPHVGVRDVVDDTLDEWLDLFASGNEITTAEERRVSDEYARAEHAARRVDRLRRRRRRRPAGMRLVGAGRRRRLVRWRGHRAGRSAPRRPDHAAAPPHGRRPPRRLRHRRGYGPPAGGLGPQPVPARLHAGLRPGRDDASHDRDEAATASVPIGRRAGRAAGQAALAREGFMFAFVRPGRAVDPIPPTPRRPPPRSSTSPTTRARRRSCRRRSTACSSGARRSATAQRLPAHEGGHIGYAVRPAHRRRGYATEILRQSLIVARAVGVDGVLVTCDDDNVGSAAVIERCGGVLESDRDRRGRRDDPALLDRLIGCDDAGRVATGHRAVRAAAGGGRWTRSAGRWDPVMAGASAATSR